MMKTITTPMRWNQQPGRDVFAREKTDDRRPLADPFYFAFAALWRRRALLVQPAPGIAPGKVRPAGPDAEPAVDPPAGLGGSGRVLRQSEIRVRRIPLRWWMGRWPRCDAFAHDLEARVKTLAQIIREERADLVVTNTSTVVEGPGGGTAASPTSGTSTS